jgi:hypothetical protein
MSVPVTVAVGVFFIIGVAVGVVAVVALAAHRKHSSGSPEQGPGGRPSGR